MHRHTHILERLESRTHLAAAVVTPAERPAVLFIRGADRSGGFLEGGVSDGPLTENLADVNNQSTLPGNHGWFELAGALRQAGFDVAQVVEPLEPGAPPTGQTQGRALDLTQIDLQRFAVVVFGSNNADYDADAASVDALEAYVRGAGGGALFISDANFGSDWADAPDSDQTFLDRFGLTVNQDNGTYPLDRAAGDYLVPDHPILAGVNRFDGEGVSPLFVSNPNVPGVSAQLLARAKDQTRVNAPPYVDPQTRAGALRPVNAGDASLLVARGGDGRVAGHYDRNTFFNQNGAGTSINRFDNRTYALNVFRWLAFGDPNPAAPRAIGGAFRVDRPQPEVAVRFDENVAPTLDVEDLVVTNRSSGETVAATSAFWAAGNTAVFRFPPATLPDGQYRATIAAAALADASGNPLQQDFTLDFTFLRGDADQDGRVNLADFNILAANFGQSPRTFSQGDFNFDGVVNLADFNILATRFGTVLEESAPSSRRAATALPFARTDDSFAPGDANAADRLVELD